MASWIVHHRLGSSGLINWKVALHAIPLRARGNLSEIQHNPGQHLTSNTDKTYVPCAERQNLERHWRTKVVIIFPAVTMKACFPAVGQTTLAAVWNRLGYIVFFSVAGFISLMLLLEHPQELRQNYHFVATPTSTTKPKPTPLPFHEIDPLFKNGVLKKQANSSRMRLLFLVGLEGTGHHYMADVLDKLCKTGHVPCPKMCPLGRAIYPALSLPETAYDYKIAREKLREEMQNLARQEEALPEGKAGVMVGFGPCRFEIGLLSYPNFNGPEKALQYVDLKVVAEEAERAGIDLRIIYLTRSARSIMISNVIHNNYADTYIMEARILVTNAAVMESFFREIDPAFTTCFRYDNITSKLQAARVSSFVAPTEYSAHRMKEVMISTVKLRPSPPGHVRFLRWQGYRASGEWDRDGEPSMGWSDGGENFGQSATVEDLRWQRRRATGKKLTEGQEMITTRLQQKLDIIEQDLCSL